jgi:hypothetical protein
MWPPPLSQKAETKPGASDKQLADVYVEEDMEGMVPGRIPANVQPLASANPKGVVPRYRVRCSSAPCHARPPSHHFGVLPFPERIGVESPSQRIEFCSCLERRAKVSRPPCLDRS